VLCGVIKVPTNSVGFAASVEDRWCSQSTSRLPATNPVLVFNLTVDVGMYFANGILVSNCDADRYCTMGILESFGSGAKLTPVLPSLRDQMHRDQQARIEQLKKRRASRQY
jgi:hypothetical protein